MIIEQQMSTEMVDEKEVETTSDRVKIFQEVEKETLEGEKVVVKELVRETTYDEMRADIENYRNQARDLENRAKELERLLP